MLRLGQATITCIWEMDDTSFQMKTFFPGSNDEAIQAELDWLAPQHYNAETGSIALSMHAWLIDTGRHKIIVDTCVGNDKDRSPRTHWSGLATPFLQRLAAAGTRPEDVDFVMCTHLHADHIGWNTRLLDGRWVPTFPRARYIFSRREYDHSLAQFDAAGGTVQSLASAAFADSVLPVVEAGRAVIVDDDFQIDDCITIAPAPGHTPGHIAIWLNSAGKRGVFSGDIVHHPIQLRHPRWSCHGCADPQQAACTRASLLETVADTGTTLFTGHFLAPHAGAIRSHRGAYMIDYLCEVC